MNSSDESLLTLIASLSANGGGSDSSSLSSSSTLVSFRFSSSSVTPNKSSPMRSVMLIMSMIGVSPYLDSGNSDGTNHSSSPSSSELSSPQPFMFIIRSAFSFHDTVVSSLPLSESLKHGEQIMSDCLMIFSRAIKTTSPWTRFATFIFE